MATHATPARTLAPSASARSSANANRASAIAVTIVARATSQGAKAAHAGIDVRAIRIAPTLIALSIRP